MAAKMIVTILWYFLVSSIYVHINGQDLHDCDNKIFCSGEILETIQLASPSLYDNIADFVEMKLKNPPRKVLAEFASIKSPAKDRSALILFAEKNFEPDIPEACSTFENQEIPELEIRVPNKTYQDFVSSVSAMWSKLIVQTSDHVEKKPEYHTLVHLPNCFVKSDEFTATTNYYDNYWIVRGLLSNGLTEIAAGIIENYTYLIREHSFVFHSNRVYSSKRTQLPLLAFMMENYFEETEDAEFLLRNLEAIEAEFVWWTKNRYFTKVINKKMYKVFQYSGTGDAPRPENYQQDHELATNYVFRLDKKKYFFSAIRAIDEAGLGFCSRFKREVERTWASINILDLVPVELNSVMQRYAFLLGRWFKNIKNDALTGEKYAKYAKNIANVIENVLWDKRRHMWFDWDLSKKKHKTTFSPTNLMPLFTMSYLHEKAAEYSEDTLKYLQEEKMIDEDFKPLHWIIPYSTSNTGTVLDFPYGSPPDTLFIMEGLSATMQQDSENLAMELAKALMKTIYIAHVKKATLYKQYSAIEIGKGVNERIGTKVSKAGYAWTNAAVLIMFEWFGDALNPKNYRGFTPSKRHAQPVDQKVETRKKGKAVQFDDDFEPTSNPQKNLDRKASSISYSESPSSSFEVSPANQSKKKNARESAMKSSDQNEPEQPLKETSSPKQGRKNIKGSKPSGGSEAVKSKQHKKRRRRRTKQERAERAEKAESEPPSNETTASEQPRRRAFARKASKRYVDESEPMDVTTLVGQSSEKKRSRRSSKLSDDEVSEGETGPAEQTKEKRGKKPKSSD